MTAVAVEGRDWAPRGRFTVGILALAYTVSFIDRQLPALLLGSIKADLRLTDTEASLLVGTSFAIVYTTAAVPLARLGDRVSRRVAIMAGVAAWGAATVVCGLARGFPAFFFARMGVGLGEAALTPNAYALIYELAPGPARGRAMGVFVLGSSLGYGGALLGGSLALQAAGPFVAAGSALDAPWRIVLVGVGVATMLLTIPLGFISNLRRRDDPAARPAGANFGVIVKRLWADRRGLAPLFVSVPLTNLASYGYAAWAPTFFERRYGWAASLAGLRLGTMEIAIGVGGALVFGWLAGRSSRSGRSAPMRLLTCAVAGGLLGLGLLPLDLSPWAAMAAFGSVSFCTVAVAVLAPLALQAVTPADQRAQTASLFLLVANLVGIGLGPTAVALVEAGATGGRLGPALFVTCGAALALALVTALAGGGAYSRLLDRTVGKPPPSA